MQRLRSVYHKTTLLIGSTKHHTTYLRPSYRSCTHDARLYRDIEGAISKVFATKLVGCHRYSLHLGMCRYVAKCLSKVMGTSYYTVGSHNYCSYRYLACIACSFSLIESAAHELLILL